MTDHHDRDDARFDAQGNTRPDGKNYLRDEANEDGIDRRGFLRCMAWAGTATMWGLSGGAPVSLSLNRALGGMIEAPRGLFFAQISDSHIGFSKAANSDVTATLQQAVDKLNALPQSPAFVLHTGDITQLAKASEFDTANEVLKGVRTDRIWYVPGEHDVAADNGASYLARYGKGTRGGGWYSFDHSGVHFVGLVNVLNLKAGGLGSLGAEQLAWLKRDLAGRSASTPVVLFAHVPLWTIYPEWGWGTDDAAEALALTRRFGSVTVLNGHIHQIMQKTEGHVAFHTAMSTAFPQPAPGTAPAPGPMTVDAATLRSVLGIAHATFVPGRGALAVVDSTLSGEAPAFASATKEASARADRKKAQQPPGPGEITIDNFAFTPPTLNVRRGERVTWINHDDVPHMIVSTRQKFAPSPVLDTDQRYSAVLREAGTFDYFCSLHPQMKGRVVVT